MSDLQQGMDCPWFSSYDKGVPHDIVIPEGGLQNILDTAADSVKPSSFKIRIFPIRN